METCKCSIVIMSHLSDAHELSNFIQYGMPSTRRADHAELNRRIEFAKFLILRYPDTSVEIDPDAEYKLFLNRNK